MDRTSTLILLCICYLVSTCLSFRHDVREFHGLRAFLEKNGAVIQPNLEPIETENAGWSLIFNSETRPNEKNTWKTIFKIPQTLLICNTTADYDDLLKTLISELTNNYTYWSFFFKSWPSQGELLWNWSKEELLELENESLMKKAEETHHRKLTLYDDIQKKLNRSFSFELFQLADFWVESRTFNVEGWYCMVPYADLPNHSSRSARTSWKWVKDRNGLRYFLLTSTVEMKPGEEFTIPYVGELTNEIALTDYGFADIDSEVQRTDLEFPDTTPLLERKKAYLKNIVLSYDVSGYWVMRFCRILTATERDFQLAGRVTSYSDYFDVPISQQREIESAIACINFLRDLKPVQTLRSNEMLYYFGVAPERKRMALAYKLSYIRLYERTARYCERYKAWLECKSSRYLRHFWKLYGISQAVERHLARLGLGLYKKGPNEMCVE